MAKFWQVLDKVLIAAIILIFCSQVADATTMTGLYKTSVPISSESPSLQATGFATALQQVLIRVSGNEQIAQIPGINQAIQSAGNYIEQYAYSEQATQNGGQQLMLAVGFSPSVINNLLRQNNQPIWGANRPLIAIWFVITDSQGTRVLANTDPLAQQIIQDAQARGLAVIVPAMDAVDTQNISVNDIQQVNIAVAENASKRYQADATLIVTLDATTATSIWSLVVQDKEQQWQVKGGTSVQIIAAGINDVADALAAQYAVTETPQNSQQIQVQISNLNAATDYAQVQRYLRSLTGVTEVDLQGLNGSTVIFNLTLSGSLQTLTGQIKLNPKLTALPNSNSQVLNYQYNSD